MDHTLLLEVPFGSTRHAQAVHDSLVPDPDLKPQEFRKKLEIRDSVLCVSFEARSVRNLRVGVSSFFDVLQETLECLSAFDTLP